MSGLVVAVQCSTAVRRAFKVLLRARIQIHFARCSNRNWSLHDRIQMSVWRWLRILFCYDKNFKKNEMKSNTREMNNLLEPEPHQWSSKNNNIELFKRQSANKKQIKQLNKWIVIVGSLILSLFLWRMIVVGTQKKVERIPRSKRNGWQ